MINRFEKFLYYIAEIDHCWHGIAAAEMEQYGLKGPYAVYFTALSKKEEGMTAVELCEYCRRNKADVSRTISHLEREGYVTRTTIGESGYRAKILLTEKGKILAQEVCKVAAEAVRSGGAGMTDEEREVFYQSLELVAGNLHALYEKGL